MSLSVLLLAAALSSEAPAASGDPIPEAAPAPAEAEVQMVCRRERVTGSNRMERVCRSRSQVKAEQDAREKRFGQGMSSADRAPLQYKPVVGR